MTNHAVPENSRVFILDDDPEIAVELAEAIGPDSVVLTRFDPAVITDTAMSASDSVVLDLSMPEYDGFQILNELTKANVAPRIVLLSGVDISLISEAARYARTLGLPVAGCLAKPVDPELLTLLLNSAMTPDRPAPHRPMPSVEEVVTAMRQGLFRLAYQPKADLRNGRWVGAEALLRCMIGGAPIPPDYLVACIEKAGERETFERWLRERAFDEARQMQAIAPGYGLSINILPASFHDPAFPDTCLQAAETAGLDPSTITLELVETEVMGLTPQVSATLARLRLKGFKLAIDDFGVGASNLDRFTRMPMNEVKIDRSIVGGIQRQGTIRRLVAALVALAHEQEMTVTAEGVEDNRTMDELRRMGCSLVQGYGIARPMEYADLLRVLPEKAWIGVERGDPT